MSTAFKDLKIKGWHTTDEIEIERRRLRGKKEPIQWKAVSSFHSLFGTYLVHSSNTMKYFVEIRSTETLENSCTCPDFMINSLGTCKHIEAVLFQLEKKLKNHFHFLSKKGVLRAEIYVHSGKIKIKWPKERYRCSKTFAILDPLFSADGFLLSDPVSGIHAIYQAYKNHCLQNKVNLSKLLHDLLEKQKKIASKEKAKKYFFEDVQQNKRSFNVLQCPLYPYQIDGMVHLAFKEKAILADEMGLGKTIQAIAACELLRQLRHVQRVLVISPASLKTEWEEQITKFTKLSFLVIQGPRSTRIKMLRKSAFFYLTNYEQIRNDYEEIQHILTPDVIILDEAQRIKNWQTKTAQSVKKLTSDYVFILTGTPIENRIDEIYSIAQMIDPKIFGPLFRFNRNFYQLNEKGQPTGYKNLDLLHKTLQPILLRRLKQEVEKDLPKRSINNYFVSMDKEQYLRYEEYSTAAAKLLAISKKRFLTKEELEKLQRFLACMRMLCDTPYILDETCNICPKNKELKTILLELLSFQHNKIIIFSEWERMLFLIKQLLDHMKVQYAMHTGSISQKNRRLEINRFKKDPDCRIFLSTDSGSTGLNLQIANVVINMDLPWHPAKLEQRIARSWRKHQSRPVQVINFVCENSIEHRMLDVLSQKQTLSKTILDGEQKVTTMSLTSGNTAFMQKLESLVGYKLHKEESLEPETKVSSKESLKYDMQAHFPENLHLLEIYHNEEGEETVFIVMDKIDDTVEEKIKNLLNQNYCTIQWKLFDKKTFLSLQDLIKTGILTRDKKTQKTLLYRSSFLEKSHCDLQKQQLYLAQKHFEKIQRKMKMSSVLASGGFPVEAIPHGLEILKEGMQLLENFPDKNKEPKEEGNKLFSEINQQQLDEEKATFIIKCIQSFMDKIEEILSQAILH